MKHLTCSTPIVYSAKHFNPLHLQTPVVAQARETPRGASRMGGSADLSGLAFALAPAWEPLSLPPLESVRRQEKKQRIL